MSDQGTAAADVEGVSDIFGCASGGKVSTLSDWMRCKVPGSDENCVDWSSCFYNNMREIKKKNKRSGGRPHEPFLITIHLSYRKDTNIDIRILEFKSPIIDAILWAFDAKELLTLEVQEGALRNLCFNLLTGVEKSCV